jgi:hypothetical protein
MAEAILTGNSDETPEIVAGLETVSNKPPPFLAQDPALFTYHIGSLAFPLKMVFVHICLGSSCLYGLGY